MGLWLETTPNSPYTDGVEVLTALLLLVFGVLMLVKSADWLVEGSATLGVKLKISPMVIGLTIVAFGTSLPELIINVFAASSGATELAIGNVFGSNITNILLILGLAAMIRPLKVHSNTAWKEIPFSVLTIIMFVALINDQFFNGDTINMLSRSDGVVLLILFAVFLYYLILLAYAGVNGHHRHRHDHLKYSLPMASGMVLLGLVGLFFGGDWVVEGARSLATQLGMSERLIGLTVVALATSLPELATTLVAVRKGETDLAVGNVIGSNIFNMTLVLGVSALIQPIVISQIGTEIMYVFVATLLLFIFLFIGDRFEFTRRDGKIMLALFVLYFAVTLWRAAG